MSTQRAIFFPGTGSQYVGMGKELYDIHRIVQEYFEEASDCLSLNMVKLCFASSDIEIMSIHHGPYALLLIETASAALLRSQSITTTCSIGIDMVSWYSSAQSAGGISLPDSLYIIRKWIESIERSLKTMPQQILTIQQNDPEIAAMIIAYTEQALQRGDYAHITSYYPHEITIAGNQGGISYIETIMQRESIPYEIHEQSSSLQLFLPEELIRETQQYLEKIDFHEPKHAIFDPLTGGLLTTAAELRAVASRWFIQPTRIDTLPTVIKKYHEAISVIPGNAIEQEIRALLPGPQWWFLDNHASFETIVEQAATKTPA